MSRPVRDIVDDALFQTSDADRFLEIIRAAGFDVVRQTELAALRVDLKERDDLTAKLLLENERLSGGIAKTLDSAVANLRVRRSAAALRARERVEAAAALPPIGPNPATQRNLEVFRLHCEGHDYSSIAAKLGLRATRVRGICVRIEARLRWQEKAKRAETRRDQ